MRKPSDKTIFLIIVLMILGGWFYWFQWRPEKLRQKTLIAIRECEKKVFNRMNELNYDWAEGKEWIKIPDQSYDDNEYGWLYPDQDFQLKTNTKKRALAECLKVDWLTND